MLRVCIGITRYREFIEDFKNAFSDRTWVDLSNVDSSELMEQCDAIVSHHVKPVVFLGFIEPGWMLDATHQTRIRTLIRTFPVGFVCQFENSIPFSWKNEIDVIYRPSTYTKYGDSYSINDGSSLYNKSKV